MMAKIDCTSTTRRDNEFQLYIEPVSNLGNHLVVKYFSCGQVILTSVDLEIKFSLP